MNIKNDNSGLAFVQAFLTGFAFPKTAPAAAAGDFLLVRFFPLPAGYVGPVPNGVVTPLMEETTDCSLFSNSGSSLSSSDDRSGSPMIFFSSFSSASKSLINVLKCFSLILLNIQIRQCRTGV